MMNVHLTRSKSRIVNAVRFGTRDFSDPVRFTRDFVDPVKFTRDFVDPVKFTRDFVDPMHETSWTL